MYLVEHLYGGHLHSFKPSNLQHVLAHANTSLHCSINFYQ